MNKRVVGVQFHPWDQVYHFDEAGLSLTFGDQVIVKTDLGMELGKVVSFSEVDDNNLDTELKSVIRQATQNDLKKVSLSSKKKDEILNKTRDLVNKHQLDMKVVDCFISFDGGKVILIFTAEGRVDFRDLVKELARNFQKSIRLQQIGIRDEAKRMGGFGPCGREQCCSKFLKNITSVTTDFARIQQVHTRGSDRISGACGRLMCCLAYEKDMYEKEMKNFPALDSMVKTGQGKGKVISCNIFKKTVNVIVDKNIIEVPLKEVKKL